MTHQANENEATLSNGAQVVLGRLREAAECWAETDAAGHEWQSVYIDNARQPGMSTHSFAGYLSALEAAGLYRSDGDDCFGIVRMATA